MMDAISRGRSVEVKSDMLTSAVWSTLISWLFTISANSVPTLVVFIKYLSSKTFGITTGEQIESIFKFWQVFASFLFKSVHHTTEERSAVSTSFGKYRHFF